MAGEDGFTETLLPSALCSRAIFLFKDVLGRSSRGSSPRGSWMLFAARLGVLLPTTRAFNSTGNLLKYKSVFANEYLRLSGGRVLFGAGRAGVGFVRV